METVSLATAKKKPKTVIQKSGITITTISAVQLRSQMQTETYSIASLTEPMASLPEFMMQMVRKWQEKQQAKAASGKPCRQKSSASCTMEDTV